jgi:hypothetical protein
MLRERKQQTNATAVTCGAVYDGAENAITSAAARTPDAV